MAVEKATIKCESLFSDDSQHRYFLSKVWDKTLPQMNIITISPSEDFNITSDLTTSIITNNAYLLGFGGYTLTNLFSKIGVDVKKVKSQSGLWDAKTDQYILSCAEKADKVVVAWGKFANSRKSFSTRENDVLNLLKSFENKTYIISDEAGRESLHPLTPSVRNNWKLIQIKNQ